MSHLGKFNFLAAISIGYAAFCFAAWQADPLVITEHNLLESLQAFSLFLALLFGLGVLAFSRNSPTSYLDYGLTVLVFAAFLRELEIEKLDVPHWLVVVGSGFGKHLLLSCLGVGTLVALARSRARLKADLLGLLRSRTGGYLLATAGFYLLGDVFDKRLLPLGKLELIFWEETAECLGTLWCLAGMASYFAAARARNPKNPLTTEVPGHEICR